MTWSVGGGRAPRTPRNPRLSYRAGSRGSPSFNPVRGPSVAATSALFHSRLVYTSGLLQKVA